MRLLFINDRLTYANATSYALDLASGLIGREHEIQLCTRGGDFLEPFRERGIETFLAKSNLLSFRKLIGFLREFNPDLVHVQSLRSVRFGRKIAHRIGKPYIVTAHTRPGPVIPPLNDRLICGCIASSEVIREALVNHHGIQKNLVRVIERGIDLNRFTPDAFEGWKPESGRLPVVGSVGRLTREKGHHVLIEAARRVLDAGMEAHFAIVGEGEEESSLRRLVEKLDLVSHVTFSPHIRGQQYLYGVFDVVAMPVLKTGVGVTAIEAMAMRKPLVTSGIGEMLHLVQDGVTGLLVREGDSEGLAERILELLRNPERMVELGEKAREWVEREFALDPMVAKTEAFYTVCLESLQEFMETS